MAVDVGMQYGENGETRIIRAASPKGKLFVKGGFVGQSRFEATARKGVGYRPAGRDELSHFQRQLVEPRPLESPPKITLPRWARSEDALART